MWNTLTIISLEELVDGAYSILLPRFSFTFGVGGSYCHSRSTLLVGLVDGLLLSERKASV